MSRTLWTRTAALLALLSISWLTIDVSTAEAQRRGRGGSGWGGSNWGGSNWGGGYYHPGYYHSGYSGWNSNWGWNGRQQNNNWWWAAPTVLNWGRPYYGYNYGYGGNYRPWGYSDYSGSPDYYSGSTYQSFYPSQDNYNQRGHITVRVADPNAELFLNGTAMRQRGQVREFDTAPLESGYVYTYEVRARWMDNGREVERTRTVRFQPGQQVTVDLTQANEPPPPIRGDRGSENR